MPPALQHPALFALGPIRLKPNFTSGLPERLGYYLELIGEAGSEAGLTEIPHALSNFKRKKELSP